MVGVDRAHFAAHNPQKRHLLNAQRCRCFYCGKHIGSHEGTQDHLIPRSKGGTLACNKVIACLKCNQRKKDRMPTPTDIERARDLYVSLGYMRLLVG